MKIPVFLTYEDWTIIAGMLLRGKFAIKEEQQQKAQEVANELFFQIGRYQGMMNSTSRTGIDGN